MSKLIEIKNADGEVIRRVRKFRGVEFDPCCDKFQATIIVDGETKCLGRHPSAIAAALAYTKAVKKYSHREIT